MKIKKFKFIDKGMSGIQVEGTDAKVKDNATVYVDLVIKYKVPIPRDIIELVQQLKYHFLVMTGFMPAEGFDYFGEKGDMVDYDKKFDKKIYTYVYDLLGQIFITGFYKEDDKIIITVAKKGYDEVSFGMSSGLHRTDPQVLSDWEESMVSIMKECKVKVGEFIEEVKLRTMQPKQYLMDLFGDKEKETDRVKNMTDAEAEAEMKEKLAAKGYIMFKAEEVMEEIHATNNAIEGDNYVPVPKGEVGLPMAQGPIDPEPKDDFIQVAADIQAELPKPEKKGRKISFELPQVPEPEKKTIQTNGKSIRKAVAAKMA